MHCFQQRYIATCLVGGCSRWESGLGEKHGPGAVGPCDIARHSCELFGACVFPLPARRAHDSGEQLQTTLFDIAVSRAVAGVGARRLTGASEPRKCTSAS